jgi:hypothetical protein
VLVSLLKRWDITIDDLEDLVDNNPSLRGVMIGYLAESKLRKMWFADPRIESLGKDDDHDRKKKGDVNAVYKGHLFRIESKSLQTNMVKQVNGGWDGRVQCDASDRRPVKFPDGSTVETTCLLTGEFDILAANIFAFEHTWRFIFAKNSDLPRSTFKKYTLHQQKYLLASLVPVSWPPKPPFRAEPFSLMDELINDKKVKKA